ncbi:putative DEAD/DEAH box helicase [Plasmodium gaboni]|uniref:Putative DEAD/DEAH box helicase n=1 Tax=Plasmodium gaboni TaxID=647221 RepID=A0A151LAI6_9APIC|nr:putative DEAD/DEAH box helicase [Plasmodium gaboni]KYN95985.1 putative DEAD/DEAH box helicase [Plasmodium gaboni]
MKERINEKFKINSYQDYSEKNKEWNIDDAINYIKKNAFFKKYKDIDDANNICDINEDDNIYDDDKFYKNFESILIEEKKYLKKLLRENRWNDNILKEYMDGKVLENEENEESGLMFVYNTCYNILNSKNDLTDINNKDSNVNNSKYNEGYIIINKNNNMKKIYINEINELLIEIIYITLTRENLENSLVDLLGDRFLDFIIQIIKNKEQIEKDIKLLSKQIVIKENTLVSNFFITNKSSKKIKNQQILYKKENLEKIIDHFLYLLRDDSYNQMKKIYIPNDQDKLEEIHVPKNTVYSYTDNITKVRISRLENLQFDKKELVSVNVLPFWHKYIFDFEYFNYVQSKVFNSAFRSNKNLLVCAPTGCGKTNIALLVILQQIILFCEQNKINLEKIVKSYLIKNGLSSYDEDMKKRNDDNENTKDELNSYGYNESNKYLDNNNNNNNNSDNDNNNNSDNNNSDEDLIHLSDNGDKHFDDDDDNNNDFDDDDGDDNVENYCGYINSKEFKIIYIAPMKSLVFEITNLFRKKLKIFNLNVCEYTKEYSLSSKELEQVHIIVTVPEKLDILLRNSNYSTTVSDESLIKYIKCLILDEVHLLNTDRGDVIETIVSRFLQYSETSQSIRRIMAMSATLPNYKDVRDFLKVENDMCYYFSEKYRSIQLDKTLYGIHEENNNKLYMAKNIYTYNEIINSLKKDKQCIIFVCSRNETNKTIEFLINHALKNNEIDYFVNNIYTDNDIKKKIKKSNNLYIKQFYEYGCTIHHAGMSRSDKILVESLFKKKVFNVLCCTSTLAWGVNLPVHTVIIKGTNYFSSESGKLEDMDILDINQIFGRCGRPQYESHGHAILITERTKLYKYIKLLTNNTIIESNFLKNIENHLNAEISIGTIKNIEDGIKWLEYTYLFIRMKKNPYLYDADINNDLNLYNKRKEIIMKAIQNLSENKLVRRVLLTNDFIGTFYGQIAAKYYVDYKTIGMFAENIQNNNYIEIIQVISKAKEFENIQIRNEDMKDFLYLKEKCDIKEEYDESKNMTLRILIEVYLRRLQINNFSIICEINYIVQNIIRILYAYYDICLNILKNISNLIMNTHNLIVAILRRLPINCGIFRHFCYKNEMLEKNKKAIVTNKDRLKNIKKDNDEYDKKNNISDRNVGVHLIDINEDNEYNNTYNNHSNNNRRNQNYTVYLKEAAVNILEKKNLTYESIENLSKKELLFFMRNEIYTNQILYYRNIIPNLYIDGYIQPITQTIMKINLNVKLTNTIWSDQWNDIIENFHIFLLNTLNNDILYFQKFSIHKKDRKKIHDISFEFPLSNQIPPQITVQFLSMNWCNLSFIHIFNTNNLFINQKINVFSEILPLTPLSTNILNVPNYIKFFSFKYFNPIQTQMFHATFHTDENILLGAPTGSGKTVIGELCILRNLLRCEDQKSVYICPMKAIVNERYKSWKPKFKSLFNKNVIELTGDKNENKENIAESNIIICTPEKLDVITRNWKNKKFVKNMNLIIFDEIHLLGQENRGGVIEILVNRFKNMQNELNKKIRLIGLTTVITSVDDLILWLDVKENYLFNFPSSCRIVPCKTHILGFPQKAYCNRMSVMNKNVFDSINQYAQTKNVLIFVSSRRQTRLTAYDIISLNLSSHNLNFLHVGNLLNDKNHIDFLLNTQKKNKKNKINNKDIMNEGDNNIGENIKTFEYMEHKRNMNRNDNIISYNNMSYYKKSSVTNEEYINQYNNYDDNNIGFFGYMKKKTLGNDKIKKEYKHYNNDDDNSDNKIHNNDDNNNFGDNEIYDYNLIFNNNKLSEEEKKNVANILFQNYLNLIENEHLKEVLKYGIGIHHAGLNENDKSIVEYLFLNKIIQILICTSTLAWGINLPAYLVIIKGNEFYDAKTKKYKDIPYTDLLQMIGRAGRPQFDDKALAILLVQEKRKNAIKNFLYHPMNIESNIMENFNEHINAEICSKVINNKEDIFNYLTKSYYFKRLFSNPSYYIKEVQYVQFFENSKLSTHAKKIIYDHLNDVIENGIKFLVQNKCLEVVQENYILNYYPTPLGHIASMYYIKCETVYFFYTSIKDGKKKKNNKMNNMNSTNDDDNTVNYIDSSINHDDNTMNHVDNLNDGAIKVNNMDNTNGNNINDRDNMNDDNNNINSNIDKLNDNMENDFFTLKNDSLEFYDIFELVAQAKEFDDIPLRHNEDKYNVKLRNQIPLDIDMNMPNVKTYLLLLSRFYECTYETVDYHIDLKLVMDQIARVINAFIDICLLFRNYNYIKKLILIFNCINQKVKPNTNSLYIIKDITEYQIYKLKQLDIYNINQLIKCDKSYLYSLNIFDITQINFILQLPVFNMNVKLFYKDIHSESEQIYENEEKIRNTTNSYINIPCNQHFRSQNKYAFKINSHYSNEIVIKIFFNFLNRTGKEASSQNVQWFAILHDTEQDESISIKRFNNNNLKKVSVISFTLEDMEQGKYNFVVYIHNDTYYGIEHEAHIELCIE